MLPVIGNRERSPYNKKKRKLSELMAIGFNFPKAFGSGEPENIKWQIQIKLWSNSAA